MANYKKLTDVEVMEEVSENSMALVNENGVLKQVPCGAGFGGGGGVATAIIKQDGYDNALAGVAAAVANLEVITFTCTNMTFAEAVEVITSGNPLLAVYMLIDPDYGFPYFANCAQIGYDPASYEVPVITCSTFDGSFAYWTADGITSEEPSMPK